MSGWKNPQAGPSTGTQRTLGAPTDIPPAPRPGAYARPVLLRSRLTSAAALVLLASGLAACGEDADNPVASDVDPVPLELTAPTYALATAEGLALRSGEVRRTFAELSSAEWLPGGRALLGRGWWKRAIWDPATDEVTPVRLGDPNRSVTQISLVEPEYPRGDAPYQLVAYDLDGEEQWRVDLPKAEVDDPRDDPDVERMYKSAHTIDGATFLYWYDNSELEEYDDYGILRVGPGGEGLEQVLEDTPVIALWLAADGSSLLATRRVSGDPCGGCQVTQQLIEIDPDDGATLATYDLPEDYDENWDVREVDKVGDRIAVRFEETEFPEPGARGPWQWVEQRGTWVLDEDGWTMVEDSDEEVSWWQGPADRIVATPLSSKQDRDIDGDEFAYWWEHDGERTRLPGLTRLDAGRRYYEASVPGQLIAPE